MIGVSASSVTPFVRGALAGARRRGARTVLLTAHAPGAARSLADVVVVLRVGPEVVAGSTRLKAGTATKLALNQITTAAFAAAGRVFGPWMLDLSRGSAKLRDRAARTVAAASGAAPSRARRLLARADGDVRVAILMARTGLDRRAGAGGPGLGRRGPQDRAGAPPERASTASLTAPRAGSSRSGTTRAPGAASRSATAVSSVGTARKVPPESTTS